MKKQRIKTVMWRGLLTGVAATVVLGTGAAGVEAKPSVADRRERVQERTEIRRDRVQDRREKRIDRAKDRRDRRQDRMERRKDRWDHRQHRLNRRYDHWDRHHDRWDKRKSWWGWNRNYGHHKKGYCSCGSCSKKRHPWGWGGWIKAAPRVFYYDEPFYHHAELGVFFGGFGLHLRLGNMAPHGYVYLHAETGKRFRSVRTFRLWHRNNPWYEPYLVVAPCG